MKVHAYLVLVAIDDENPNEDDQKGKTFYGEAEVIEKGVSLALGKYKGTQWVKAHAVTKEERHG